MGEMVFVSMSPNSAINLVEADTGQRPRQPHGSRQTISVILNGT
jgi:hypothetical protein